VETGCSNKVAWQPTIKLLRRGGSIGSGQRLRLVKLQLVGEDGEGVQGYHDFESIGGRGIRCQ
jgi:hypothetical protein